VITVDTALAHLAASMGKPTWILVPDRAAYWTWGPRGDRTPWYPTARLYRKAGDWSDALTAIERDLIAP
jgi:ADP-heptose:LPS heptosyltransferase